MEYIRNMKMASFIRDFGLTKKDGEKESNSFQMEQSMKENGRRIRLMDSEE